MPSLCQLTDVKTWLGISDTSLDTLLARLIAAASDSFLNEIHRPNMGAPADYTEHFLFRREPVEHYSRHCYFWGRQAQEIYLREYPINSVASVSIDDNALTEVDDPATDTGWWFDATRSPEDRQKIMVAFPLEVNENK